EDTLKRPAIEPLDKDNRIAFEFDITQRFGITTPRLKTSGSNARPKKLTRYERGDSNNTCLRIDSSEYIFGSPAPGIDWAKMGDKLQRDLRSAGGRRSVSVMDYSRDRVLVTQTVEIIVGEQTRLFDTALVTYQIENYDNRLHQVSLRAMIDTYAGAVDGVPFLVGPTDPEPAQLVDAIIQLGGIEVPSFFRVVESGKFNDANGVVAEIGLKLKGCEPPDRVVICRWPQTQGASNARWEWPFQAMNQPATAEKDSC